MREKKGKTLPSLFGRVPDYDGVLILDFPPSGEPTEEEKRLDEELDRLVIEYYRRKEKEEKEKYPHIKEARNPLGDYK